MNFPCSEIFSFFHLFQLIYEHKPRKGKQAAVYSQKKETNSGTEGLDTYQQLVRFV